MITPIERLTPINKPQQVMGEPQRLLSGGSSFGDIFNSLMSNVSETEKQKSEAEYLLATGQLDNPAALMIATSKNTIAVNLLVQLRTRALEAYNELARMSL